jgi:hypothetical protein
MIINIICYSSNISSLRIHFLMVFGVVTIVYSLPGRVPAEAGLLRSGGLRSRPRPKASWSGSGRTFSEDATNRGFKGPFPDSFSIHCSCRLKGSGPIRSTYLYTIRQMGGSVKQYDTHKNRINPNYCVSGCTTSCVRSNKFTNICRERSD